MGRGHSLPFSDSLHLLPLRSAVKYVREIERASIAPFQKCCARTTGLVVICFDAWVTMAVSALSAQRAQFTSTTQGIVAHSKDQGSEAGAQPTFFMSARPKSAETPYLSLAGLCAAQSFKYAYTDALKEYKPQQVKGVKWTHASSPGSALVEELCLPPGRAWVWRRTHLLRTHARPGGWHDSSRWDDPGLEA